ncbi:hypothetical protein V8C37DRAFT_376883 [Trichoderma ceciliae]
MRSRFLPVDPATLLLLAAFSRHCGGEPREVALHCSGDGPRRVFTVMPSGGTIWGRDSKAVVDLCGCSMSCSMSCSM